MRIAVTGATSFIGKKLVNYLADTGEECVAIVRKGKGKAFEREFQNVGQIVELDMEEYSQMGRKTGKIDCLISLAWKGTRGQDRMDVEAQRFSYYKTLDAIRSVLDNGCSIVVTAGSQAEYGSCNCRISESTPADPNTEYGRYKLKLYEDAEVLCKKCGARIIEPRYFSLYGPGDTDKTMVVDIIKKMMNNAECDMTEAIQMWDYLYIDDAIEAIALLLKEKVQGGVYNMGSGDCRPLKQFIEEMKRVLGSSSILNYGAIPYPATGMVSIEPDISKLVRTTGWTPHTTFEEGVRRVADAIRRENEKN